MYRQGGEAVSTTIPEVPAQRKRAATQPLHISAYATRSWLLRAAVFLLLMTIAFSTIYPVLFTVNAALKTQKGWAENRFAISIPPSLDSFRDAWRRSNVLRSFTNSLITTSGGVVGAWIVCSMAAFAATKLRFRGRDAIFVLLLASMMIPMQTILYPFYVQVRDLKMINQYHGLILTFTAFAIPMTTYLLAAYFKGIPDDLLDAARIDGASTWQALVHVIVPIARPALAAIGIINFVWMWNDLLMPLMVMQRPDRTTLIVSLSMLRGQYGASTTLVCAGVIIAVTPVVLMYLVAQEQLVKGMTMGAVKGG
jgi:raffinose/stachyose/melibiose transport system permease protein